MHREHYPALPQHVLAGRKTALVRPDQDSMVSIGSPALEVMTDLRRVAAATIPSGLRLADANQIMILRGVRLLFIYDGDHVAGLVSTEDLLSERPLQTAAARGLRVDELLVNHVMTPIDKVEVVSLLDVIKSDVGHVLATLTASGRRHALVVEVDDDGTERIRGIFSASQLARQLGVPVSTGEVARTFAEIEAAIAG
jgi:CBS domain-containing protein